MNLLDSIETFPQSEAMYKEKQTIINVQANPNTQPGGVHGAFCNEEYHSLCTPDDVNSPPKAKAAKFSIKKRKMRKIMWLELISMKLRKIPDIALKKLFYTNLKLVTDQFLEW